MIRSDRSPRAREFFALAVVAALVALIAPAAGAQTDTTAAAPKKLQVMDYSIHPASGPIVIDGVLDEAAWGDALEVSDFREFRPGDNLAPRARTVCKVAYDHDHLYFSARCFDPEPAKIRAHLTDRDRLYNDDFVGLSIDTFLDHRTGYEFLVNPLGIQGDLAMSNGGDEDDSWDGLWQSAARVDSLGWTCEVSIPTRTLRFRDVPVNQWGFSFFRTWPRDSRYQFISNRTSRDEPCWMCQYDHLDSLSDLEAGRNLQVLPYATQSLVGTRSALGSPFKRDEATKVGATVKWGISPSITLDGTLRPDFAQVEADESQISVNNASALYFNEKRPFFLEGNTIFQGIGNLYYSRNINDPSLAGKLTGREGRFQFGALVAHDRTTPLILPYSEGSVGIASLGRSSDDLLLRGRRDLMKDSNIGFTLTDREYGAGNTSATERASGTGFNRLGAVDAQIRLADHLRWTWYVAGSSTKDVADPDGYIGNPGETHSGYSTYQELFYNSRVYNGGVWFTSKSHDYRADLGFQDQNDYKAVEGWHELDFSPAGKVVDYIQPTFYFIHRIDGQNRLREQVFQSQVDVRFKGQWEINVAAATKATRFLDTLYHHEALRVNIDKRGGGLVGFHGNYRTAHDVYRGGEHDFPLATRVAGARNFTASFDVRPTSNLLLTVAGQDFRLSDRDADSLRVGVELGLLRVTYQFTPRLFVRMLTQYQRYNQPWLAPEGRIYKSVTNQFLMSYKLNYATVFFLGLNGDYDNSLAYEDGNMPPEGAKLAQNARGAFAKMQYLWSY